MRPSTVHNSQHVWLMFDTESQLFLTHGQACGLDSNDADSFESGPGSRLGDSGYRQEALLERCLGAEGHPQSSQRCISIDQKEELQDHGNSIQLHEGNERERQVAWGNPAGYYDGFRGHVIEVHDQSSPSHEAQEEIRKEGAHVSLARYQPEETQGFLRAASSTFETWEGSSAAKCRPGIDVRSIVFTDEKFFRFEQGDRKQRVWLESGTTKKVTLFRVTRLFRLFAH